jgi:pimeloyl-ACP methyl ester carboxylesterase
VYKYWGYHGFLCRYAQTDLTDNIKSDNPDGVLLVHGFGASGAQWNKAMTELSQQDLGESCRQGLAPDLLGFGEAEKPALSYTGYLWDSFIMEFVKEVAVPKHGWKSFVVGGNSIGGFTAISLAASDTSTPSDQPQVTSSGAPGTNLCTGLVLMNSAGPVFSEDEISKVTDSVDKKLLSSVAQMTITGELPPCSPPPRPVGRAFGNALLSYLRPRIQDICRNLYPTNPAAVDEALCAGIRRDSLDPGAIYVMMAGAKLPKPRTANELLGADFGGPPKDHTHDSPESFFEGPVLVAQGVLDPLNDSQDRMEKFGALRDGIRIDPIPAGHCPHDELPDQVARSIAKWMLQTQPATPVGLGSAVSSNVSVQYK